MTRQKLRATAPDGTVFTRTTQRTYTHCVVAELVYPDRTGWSSAQWAGSPALAIKAASKLEQALGRTVGMALFGGTPLQAVRVHTLRVGPS